MSALDLAYIFLRVGGVIKSERITNAGLMLAHGPDVLKATDPRLIEQVVEDGVDVVEVLDIEEALDVTL